MSNHVDIHVDIHVDNPREYPRGYFQQGNHFNIVIQAKGTKRGDVTSYICVFNSRFLNINMLMQYWTCVLETE